MTRMSRLNHKGNTGRRAERKAASDLGGRVQPGSGGVGRGRGDIKTEEFLYEHKATTKDSFRLTRGILLKAEGDADGANRDPVVVVAFVDDRERVLPPGRIYVLSERVFKRITERGDD